MADALTPLPVLLGATPSTVLDWERWNKLLGEVQSRLARLEILRGGLEQAYQVASDVALSRINEILGPMVEEVQELLAGTNLVLEGAEELLEALQAGEIAISNVTGLADALTHLENTISAAIAAEVINRNSAISSAVSAEAVARGNADTALSDQVADARKRAIAYAVAL